MEEPISKENIIENQFDTNVPAQITTIRKAGEFLVQDIDWRLSDKQLAVLKDVNDFWHQEITDEQANEFLFQKMNF